MNTTPATYQPWIYRLAILTVVLSLLPIVLGALTTTKDAGMAFPDWPTSDGQGMFSYPWLKLVDDMGTNPKSYAKFLEHSHRLAGALIGLVAIGLAVVSHLKGTKGQRYLGIAVLLAVIVQGLIGGYRVELNERGLAMLHGLSASLVFALMSVTATVASPTWSQCQPSPEDRNVRTARRMALVFFLFLMVQFLLGGLIRHPLGTRAPIHEHLGFGVLAIIWVHVVLIVVARTRIRWLRQAMRLLLFAVGGQFLLGLLTYAAKFGVPSLGIVAVAQSTAQVLTRTGHMVLGVLVIGAAAVLVVRCYRISFLTQRAQSAVPAES